MSATERRRVLWFGAKPTPAEVLEFANRGLHLEFPSHEDLTTILPTTRGVVLRYDSQKPTRVLGFLHEHAFDALNHGILICPIADRDEEVGIVQTVLKQRNLSDRVKVKKTPSAHELAQSIHLHDPGPRANFSLEIGGHPSSTVTLDSVSELFLKRAFWDCKKITLSSLGGGKTADVFCVHAVFRESPAGPRPLPFFSKIGRLGKIRKEQQNYRDYALHFVPFNLRPNLDENRCIEGYDQGMLVGNFVENAEPLLDVVRREHGQRAIHSLFDDALRGWRLQAEDNLKMRWSLFINDREVFDPTKVTPERVATARTLGATKQPDELIRILSALDLGEYRYVPIHGDLHALNVMVRNNDGILIDFGSTRVGPLTADPASLEVSLTFHVGGTEDDDLGWTELIGTLYSKEFLERVPPPAREPRLREWLWTVVRQIRQFALGEQGAKFEYRAAIAMYLLRHCMFPAGCPKDNHRRAYAYVTAERIVLGMATEMGVAIP